MSQVVTLYKDKEKTDALYPRTKVSAISDDNNTSLQELLNRYEIIDNLTSYDKDKALSANQGRELNDSFNNYYNKTEVNDLLNNIDVAGMVKQEEGGIEEGIVTPTNADTLGGKLTANNVVFYEEEIVDEVGQVVVRNADKLENHPASYFATGEELNTKTNKSDVLTLEEIQASTDLTGKIASASGLKELDNEYINFRNTDWLFSVNLNNYIKSGIYLLANNISNSPIEDSVWSPMLVLGNGTDTARQIIITSYNTMYIRKFQSRA